MEGLIEQLAGDVAGTRNQLVENLAPVGLQLRELERRIDVPLTAPEVERIAAGQHQALRAQLAKVQEGVDALHLLVVGKANQDSTDSNFLVLQDEVDNLKVKLNFVQGKAEKAQEGL
jgi:type IV pilus biogenesis protein CpaD/CtpE